jgi:hypothetical protein
VTKKTKYHLGIEIDKLTNSIFNTISGDSFPTDLHPASKADLKNAAKKNGWLFNSSWDKGYQGFVSFTSKTRLIEHYEKTLGATHVGGHKMVIFPQEALKLIKKYFPT